MNAPAPRSVFISYSRADKPWLDRLTKHLALYLDGDVFEEWDDRRIEPGNPWLDDIRNAMKRARVAVLLLSADFFASDFIKSTELPELRRAAKAKEILLLPLFIGDCAYELSGLDVYHALNDPKLPLKSQYPDPSTADSVLKQVAKKIYEATQPRSMTLARSTRREASPSLPGRFVAATLGWLNFRAAADFRGEVLDTIATSGTTRSVAGDVLRVRDRVVEKSFDQRITIVCGAAGVGKSTYVSDVLRRTAHDFDLMLMLNGSRIAPQDGEASPTRTGEEMLSFVNGLRPLREEQRLRDHGLAHALNSRRVLILIEDAHRGRSTAEVLRNVQRYLSRYHANNNRVRIVATTRDTAEDLGSITGSDALVVAFHPMSPQAAQNLFFTLCIDNGIPRDELIEQGEKLGSAFTTEAVRTPLFVTICAVLACRGQQRVGIDRILRMTTSEVFDMFIEDLLTRSDAPEEDRSRIRSSYRRLALEIWPEWENCRGEDALNALRRMDDSAEERLRFFERNGFLFRHWYRATRVHFPHHAMADYLAASAMLETDDFLKLRGHTTRTDGVVRFLAEMALGPQTLERIAKFNLGAALEIVESRAHRGHPLPVDMIVQRMAAWATASDDGSQSPETWLGVRDAFEGRTSDAWLSTLGDAITHANRVTAHAIAAAATLGKSQIIALLHTWIENARLHSLFSTAARNPDVERYLVARLAQYPSPVGRVAFRILLLQATPEARDEITKTIRAHVTELDLDDIKALTASGLALVRIVGVALAEHPISVKRQVAASFLTAIGHVLIPCGTYEISVDDKPAKTRINAPLLVPSGYEILSGHFRSSERSSFGDALRHKLPPGKTVMSEMQARVAAAHFSSSALGGMGVGFARGEEDLPEIFWEQSTRKPGLYVMSSRTTALMMGAPATQREIVPRVAYRAIDQL